MKPPKPSQILAIVFLACDPYKPADVCGLFTSLFLKSEASNAQQIEFVGLCSQCAADPCHVAECNIIAASKWRPKFHAGDTTGKSNFCNPLEK
jgi:hypothetical protein